MTHTPEPLGGDPDRSLNVPYAPGDRPDPDPRLAYQGSFGVPGGDGALPDGDGDTWLGGPSYTASQIVPPAAPAAGVPPRWRQRARLVLAGAATVIAVAGLVAAGLALRPAAARHQAAVASHPVAPSPAAVMPPPAVTLSAAQQILASYVKQNNAANAARSDTQLAGIETGGALALDEGGYQFTRGKIADGQPVAAYQPISATDRVFDIPRLASWPKWFVVESTWSGAAMTPSRQYTLFAQASPGARWLDADEPALTGAAPQLATSPGGYVTAVNEATVAGLAMAPGSMPAATAAYLDGSAGAISLTGLNATQDQKDQAFWHTTLPGSPDTVHHSDPGFPVYALRTRDGGALAFYTVAATLTLDPPAGTGVGIPGYYSSAAAVSQATIPYGTQIAAVVPPHARPGPVSVIAQFSSIAAKN